jgi:hypothetical protein
LLPAVIEPVDIIAHALSFFLGIRRGTSGWLTLAILAGGSILALLDLRPLGATIVEPVHGIAHALSLLLRIGLRASCACSIGACPLALLDKSPLCATIIEPVQGIAHALSLLLRIGLWAGTITFACPSHTLRRGLTIFFLESLAAAIIEPVHGIAHTLCFVLWIGGGTWRATTYTVLAGLVSRTNLFGEPLRAIRCRIALADDHRLSFAALLPFAANDGTPLPFLLARQPAPCRRRRAK